MTAEQSQACKLKPCPFPHDVKRGVYVEVDDEDFFIVRVACSDCGCAGPYVPMDESNCLRTKAEAEAVRLWNTRTSPPAPSEEDVERLKTALNEADRRAGAAERENAHLREAASKREFWLDKAKRDAGYHRNVSFDVVWADALEALRTRAALSVIGVQG